ncbi:hypothetical protein IPJ70_03690 [Candidatus Campbellbacteria bacterium]|nr:MAG: hypothetical protein IPJ70_03690 [Candidatus Campbellbacteria bacterium]
MRVAHAVSRDRHQLRLVPREGTKLSTDQKEFLDILHREAILSPRATVVWKELQSQGLSARQAFAAYWLMRDLFVGKGFKGFNQDELFAVLREIEEQNPPLVG